LLCQTSKFDACCLLAFGLLVKKALSHQEVCEAVSLAEASQDNEPNQDQVPHPRESFFKKALTHLTRDLILQRSKTLQKFLSTLIEVLQSLETNITYYLTRTF
jgi:hypothetical protein